jgi:TolB-like protein
MRKIVNRFLDPLEVSVDGEKELTLGDNSIGRIIIENGMHTLTFTSLNGYLKNTPVEKKNITINLNSQQQTINVKIGPFHGISVKTNTPTETSAAATKDHSTGIEGATNRASEALINNLSANSTVAVLSVSSRDRDTATFVIEELEFQFVDSKKFKIVDRKTLDTIRAEQNFQLSGDVDDNSAVSIGKMIGANIVITGTISGSGTTQRLTIKALDVKTAQIITMAREQF